MTEKNRFDKLNLLRAIAFLCIFLRHTIIFMPVLWDDERYAWLLFTPAWAGVWIFIILSGYGIGAGYYSERYETNINGIMRYYIRRLSKIIPLYWFYIFTVALFIKPDILSPSAENLSRLLSLFFFNYQEEFLSREFGLAWYLTTLVRLYLIAPFFYIFARRFITTKKRTILALLILMAGGFAARIAMRYHISLTGEGWSEEIYKPFYFNLDLFFAGFLMNGFKKAGSKHDVHVVWKVAAVLGFVGLISYNCKIYYKGTGVVLGNYCNMDVYMYLMQTVYIIMVCACVYIFDVRRTYKRSPLNRQTLRHNPLRVIDYFPVIQFPVYLFHSTVLLCMQNGYSDDRFSGYVASLRIAPEYQDFAKGCIFIVEALVFSLIWAVIISRFFHKRTQGRFVNTLLNLPYDKALDKIKNRLFKAASRVFRLSDEEYKEIMSREYKA